MRQENVIKTVDKEGFQGAYELPEGWKWARLGNVAEVNPSKSEIKDLPENIEISFIPMDAVDGVRGKIISVQIRILKDVKKGYTYFRENDVIFAKITPCMENGKCAIANDLVNGIGFGSTEFHVVRSNKNTISEWIWHYLRQKWVREEATKYFTGSVGQQRVPEEFLEKLEIPFPPLEEQKRILARIDELFRKFDEIKKVRKEMSEKAKALFPSALHEVFSKADEKGWKWVQLGNKDLFHIETGATPKTDAERYWKGGNIKWVTPKDLGRLPGKFILDTERKITEEGFKSCSTTIIPNGSIIISTRAPIGHIAILGDDMCFNQGCKGIVIKDNRHVVNDFLYYALLTKIDEMNALGSGATFKEISRKKLSSILIALPSLEEQKRIVAHLGEIQKKARMLQKLQERAREKIDNLRASILSQAFKGEL